MRSNHLRQLLNEGKPSIATHVMASWPGIIEMIGHTGAIDYVELVGEGLPYDLEGLENLCHAVDLFHNMTSMIRIEPEPATFTAARAIGSGVQNVLFANVRTVEEAKERLTEMRLNVVDEGERHLAQQFKDQIPGKTRLAGYFLESGTPAYTQSLKDCVVALKIEQRETLENLEAILSVGGIDMVVFGGSDYSPSITKPGAPATPEVQQVRDRVFRRVLSMGVQPRADIGSAEQAKPFLDMGVRHFAMGTDLAILFNWWKENAQELGELIAGA